MKSGQLMLRFIWRAATQEPNYWLRRLLCVCGDRQAAVEAIIALMKSRRRTGPSSERLRTTPVLQAYQIRGPMSALGQKQTICSAKRHVRFTLDGVIGKSACGYTVGLVSSKAGTALAYLSSHATTLGCPPRPLPSCRKSR